MLRYSMVAVALIAAPSAAETLIATPLTSEGQTIRYEQGLATVEDDLPGAGVSIMPGKQLYRGSLQFKVAVYNKSATPVNVGVENVMVSYRNVSEPCFTVDELTKAAKKRAMWSQIGYALLAGAAAGVQNNNTTVTTYAPRGRVYRTVIDRPGLSDGQLLAVAGGGAAIAVSQIELQKTVASLNDEIIQTTTLDPQTGYGGRVIARKLKGAKAGDIVSVLVTVGSEVHTFNFKLAKA